MSDAPKLYVTLQDIADIAKVGRSAVGNWRKRHPDFPLPNSSDRFDLDEVERWLIARGKISERAPRDFMLWQLADELRGRASPSQTWRFVIASLVYLEACERSERAHADPQRAVIVSEEHTWALVRHTPDAELSSGLLAAVRSVEAANPQLEGVIAPGLDLARHLDPSVVRSLLDALEEATADPTTSRVALFEEAVNRGRDADRFTGEFSTPDDVTELMARLGGQPLGTIFDPAVGEGGLLLTAALRADLNGGKRSRLVGFELNEDVTRVTRARFFLYEFDVELHHVDAFRVPADGLPEAALALVDPPLGQMDWGDADIYLDRRWTHGVPPPKRADLAWLQLAVASLAPGGRAVVTTSPTALSAGGREAAIRSSLLASGLVIAVILCPAGFARTPRAPSLSGFFAHPARLPRNRSCSLTLDNLARRGVRCTPWVRTTSNE